MTSFIKYQIGSGDPNYPAVAFKRFENGTVQIYQYSRHSNRHGKTIYMTEKQFWEFISKANEIRKDEIICNEYGGNGTQQLEGLSTIYERPQQSHAGIVNGKQIVITHFNTCPVSSENFIPIDGITQCNCNFIQRVKREIDHDKT